MTEKKRKYEEAFPPPESPEAFTPRFGKKMKRLKIEDEGEEVKSGNDNKSDPEDDGQERVQQDPP